MKDARPILTRLEEAAQLNVAPRARENLCAEAASVVRGMLAALERISALGDWVLLGVEYREEIATIARAEIAKVRG